MKFDINLNSTDALLDTFRRHAAGVAVITTTFRDQPVGFTATSITSLGAKPPLIMFSVAKGASSYEPMLHAEHIALHTLGKRNLALAQRMAADHTQRFATSDWELGPHGVPVFPAATSVLIVKIREVIEIESNAVVIGEVLTGATGEEDEALLYQKRAYYLPGERLSEPRQ